MVERLAIGVAIALLVPISALAGERTVVLAVERMTCALCPVTVAKAIDRVEGVVKVSVDYGTKRAVVRYDVAATTWQKIAEASAHAGYPARKVP